MNGQEASKVQHKLTQADPAPLFSSLMFPGFSTSLLYKLHAIWNFQLSSKNNEFQLLILRAVNKYTANQPRYIYFYNLKLKSLKETDYSE